ncbi:hypothetical protein Pint_03694 [Pistacia integerrima]|uniref:Uncharacterized protein n=1 Tax=Pistacia integerrima TaxID=434235 RepID=A0ACC0Z5V6_9ROSI|nr:hypothetical protein Pint_03694 [Pistacia integerrima]
MIIVVEGLVSLSLIVNHPLLSNAISHCNGPCKTLDDCDGQLICINGKCNDDPCVGNHICAKPGPTPSDQCQSSGGDGGGPSERADKYHNNSELIVVLSNGWCNRGSRCGKNIKIRASNGKNVMAKVVDECDSVNGCDHDHDYPPPCSNDIVDGSDAVWHALGLNIEVGVVDVTWSMA